MASLWRSFKGLQLFNRQLPQSINPMLSLIEVRTKSTGPNKPIKRIPEWLPKPEHEPLEEHLSDESKAFIQEYQERYTKTSVQSPLKKLQFNEAVWTPYSTRTGLIAKKIGIYPMWLKDGKRVLSTLLEICNVEVVKYIPPERNNPRFRPMYLRKELGCLLVGAEDIDAQLLTREYYDVFEMACVTPKKHLMRFFVTADAALPPGTRLNVNHFRVGDVVDVRAKTIDRGFQGVMKRWGFHGMPASHGVTKTHRRPGNIGSGSSRARVVPGTKMPGHMGNRWRMLRGMRVLRVNPEYNVLWVLGPNIPGETNSYCYLYDTVLRNRRVTNPPFPTNFPDANDMVESYADDVHRYGDPSIIYNPDS